MVGGWGRCLADLTYTQREDPTIVDPMLRIRVYGLNSTKGSHQDERRGSTILYHFSSLPSGPPTVADVSGQLGAWGQSNGNMRDGAGPLIH